jgi:hypothetical protein
MAGLKPYTNFMHHGVKQNQDTVNGGDENQHDGCIIRRNYFYASIQ